MSHPAHINAVYLLHVGPEMRSGDSKAGEALARAGQAVAAADITVFEL